MKFETVAVADGGTNNTPTTQVSQFLFSPNQIFEQVKVEVVNFFSVVPRKWRVRVIIVMEGVTEQVAVVDSLPPPSSQIKVGVCAYAFQCCCRLRPVEPANKKQKKKLYYSTNSLFSLYCSWCAPLLMMRVPGGTAARRMPRGNTAFFFFLFGCKIKRLLLFCVFFFTLMKQHQQQQQQKRKSGFISLSTREPTGSSLVWIPRDSISHRKSNRASISVWRHSAARRTRPKNTQTRRRRQREIESVDDHFTSLYLVHMAVVSCCRCTAAVVAVAAGCCAPAADRNRARVPDDAGNDADDGVAGVVVAGAVVVGVADDDDGGGAAAVAGGVAGGGRRWSPSLNSGNHLLLHRKPHRLQKANRQPLGAAGAHGAAGPRRPIRTREPFLPFRSA